MLSTNDHVMIYTKKEGKGGPHDVPVRAEAEAKIKFMRSGPRLHGIRLTVHNFGITEEMWVPAEFVEDLIEVLTETMNNYIVRGKS